jgi:hypothetical protein
MATQIFYVGENESVPITLSATSHDTTGLTVKSYVRSLSGTAVEVGSTTGAAAGVAIIVPVALATVGVTVGERYEVHIVGDPTGTPLRMLPNPSTSQRIIFKIVDLPGVT